MASGSRRVAARCLAAAGRRLAVTTASTALVACTACAPLEPHAGLDAPARPASAPPSFVLASRPVEPAALATLDAQVVQLMQQAHVVGMALALIDDGRVVHVRAYGERNQQQHLPLTVDTVMYGASLTKAEFAELAMQLVDDGKLVLDAPIASMLPKPLPEYAPYAALAGDERWRRLTPRHVLTHSTGFANFAWLEPDKRLRFHFEPGTRYAYSGDGINLLQFAIETGLGIDVGGAMQSRVFDRFGMTRTAMSWRDDMAADVADGYDIEGAVRSHAKRVNVRAAGSMDTTIADQARFWAAAVRGDGLSAAAREEWLRPTLPIASARQFPSLAAATAVPRNERIGLAAALGVITFRDAAGGPGWYKGGHDDTTGNMAICMERGRRCLVMLGNDVRAERIYPEITRRVLGPTAMPWSWEYGIADTWAQAAPSP